MRKHWLYVLYDKNEPSKEYEHDVKSREEITEEVARQRNDNLRNNDSALRWIKYEDYEKI